MKMKVLTFNLKRRSFIQKVKLFEIIVTFLSPAQTSVFIFWTGTNTRHDGTMTNTGTFGCLESTSATSLQRRRLKKIRRKLDLKYSSNGVLKPCDFIIFRYNTPIKHIPDPFRTVFHQKNIYICRQPTNASTMVPIELAVKIDHNCQERLSLKF